MQTRVYTVPQLPDHMVEIIRKHAPKKPQKFFIKRSPEDSVEY